MGVLFKGTESDEEMLEKLLGKEDEPTGAQQPPAAPQGGGPAPPSTGGQHQASAMPAAQQALSAAQEQPQSPAQPQQQPQPEPQNTPSPQPAKINNDVLAEMAATKLLINLLGHLNSSTLSNFVKINLLSQEEANRLEAIASMYGKVERNVEVMDVIMSGYVLHMLNAGRNDELMSLLAVLELREDDAA